MQNQDNSDNNNKDNAALIPPVTNHDFRVSKRHPFFFFFTMT